MGKSKKSKQSDIKPGQPKVVCFFCGSEFAEEGLLILHQQAKHFKCTDCSGFQGGRCPTHGCKHKCLVTLSCHWKKDHKGELKTIPGAKEGREDPKQFWRVHGISGTPQDFLTQLSMPASIPADAGPPLPESDLPPIPHQPPMPAMTFPDFLAEWSMPGPMDPLPVAPGQGDGGGVRDAESSAPSNEPETPDFAQQVQAWMAAREAEAAEEALKRSQEEAPPISMLSSPASEPVSSAPLSNDAFTSDSLDTLARIPEDRPTTPARIPEDRSSTEVKQWQPSENETMPRIQDPRFRSGDRQDTDRRSRSRDRADRTSLAGRGRHEERMRDDRVFRRSRDRGRDGNAGRNVAIAITQGRIPSRIWLQNLMGPYGRLEYSHTGNRLNPERDPPWVQFATSGAAEDAMNAINAGTVLDGDGAPIRAQWKNVSQKGKGKGEEKDISSRDLYRSVKGKGKGDQKDMSSRDLYRRGPENRGSRDDRRRSRRSSSSSRSARRNRTRR